MVQDDPFCIQPDLTFSLGQIICAPVERLDHFGSRPPGDAHMTSKSPVEKYSVQITESLDDKIGTPMISVGIVEGGIEATKGPAFCIRRSSVEAVMVVYLLSCCSWTDEWSE